MHLIIHSLLALAAVLPTQAFTNGTLIPSYFCNPVADGLPKSLGQLIPFLQKDVDVVAFNPNASANLLKVPMTGSHKPGNAGYILAGFHNTLNKITPLNPGLGVTVTNSTAAVPTLKAGVPNLLTLSSLANGVALIGALIHSRTMNGTPVGEFADSGKIFVPFPGCGKNKQGKIAGVVHSDAISDTGIYSTLTYTPPKCAVPGNKIVLGGLSVTDNGFGVWNVTFAVTGGLPVDASGHCTTTTVASTTGTAGVVTIVEVLGSKSVHSSKEKRGAGVEQRYEATKPRDVRLRSEVAFEA